jgi:MFS family permease
MQEGHIMFHWYRELSTGEKRTFWGCFGGWAMDAMDVQLFSFLIPVLIAAWGISATDAGSLATAALISSAVGGWICGILCDRYGRVRIMQFTILWYAFFTFLSGFAQSYEQLLVLRVLQGLGFGGEWAAGAVLMGEIIRPQHRGKAVGCVQSAYAVGWAAAAIISTILLTLLPTEYGWRAVFWIGVLPAGLVIYIRRYIKEPEVFEETRQAIRNSGEDTGPLAIFRPAILKTTILTSLLALGIQGASYSITTWLPTFLKTERGFSTASAGSYVFVVTFGAFIGYIASAYLSDAIGRRRNFLLFSLGSLLVVALYTYVPVGDVTMLLLGIPLGFFSIGIYSALGPYFTELFPTAVRASGQSFAYNFGRSLGALVVTLVGVLAQLMPLGHAIGLVGLAGYFLAAIATMLLPETRGIDLHMAGKKTEPVEIPAATAA